jgi:hypothetical protein
VFVVLACSTISEAAAVATNKTPIKIELASDEREILGAGGAVVRDGATA